ncbi:MAG: hypothetical protein A2X30_01370 [Elusimicrobia bacterium GWB2_63_16]|nr:MAG: hypothetical protein A2X30_01370 [Elusimicrobia bacterium GWB2_63_16]
MGGEQAILAAAAADAIIGFLYNIHRQDRIPQLPTVPLYDKNQEFNAYIDETSGKVSICGVEFRPSEVLFEMEPQTYRMSLAEFELEEKDVPPDASTGEVQ